MDTRSLSQLLPAQDVPEFIRFRPDTAGANAWIDNLPRANLGDVTRALYQALTELNRFPIPPRQRLQVLEALDPLLGSVRSGLARHYLNQPIVLPAQAARVAHLAETLNREAAQNYARIIDDADDAGSSLLAIGADRAGAALNANLLLSYQLYREPVEDSWLMLHRIHQRLRDAGLDEQDVGIGDAATRPGHQYRRALLLGSARPSQLRQRDLDILFPLLADWAKYVRLTHSRGNNSLWTVSPTSDRGPLLSERADPDAGWELDTRAVADHLAEYPGTLSPNLVQHLQTAWQTPASRSFVRLEGKDELYITLGLTATHHFVADEEDFQILVSGEADPWDKGGSNPFLRNATVPQPLENNDIWSSAYKGSGQPSRVAVEAIDYNIRQHHRQNNRQERYSCHLVHSLNSSPTGYCLQWAPDAKVSLRSGELVGLRPNDQSHWTIAAVRWVQLRREGPSIGVQLLSPTAVPYAARPAASDGTQGDFQRVLMLPEIAAIGQPTMLITPHLPFREGQRVELTQHGEKTAVKLTRLVASTGVFSQFEFRRLSAGGATRSTDQNQDGFDALWDQL